MFLASVSITSIRLSPGAGVGEFPVQIRLDGRVRSGERRGPGGDDGGSPGGVPSPRLHEVRQPRAFRRAHQRLDHAGSVRLLLLDLLLQALGRPRRRGLQVSRFIRDDEQLDDGRRGLGVINGHDGAAPSAASSDGHHHDLDCKDDQLRSPAAAAALAAPAATPAAAADSASGGPGPDGDLHPRGVDAPQRLQQ